MPAMTMDTEGLSPTHKRLVNLFLDGYWHSKEDIYKCLPQGPDGYKPHVLRGNLYELRNALRPRGFIIEVAVGEDREGKKVSRYCMKQLVADDPTPVNP